MSKRTKTNAGPVGITVKDAAGMLGVTYCAVRHYLLRGVVTPATDSGGRPLLTPADVDAIRRWRAVHGRGRTCA